MGRAVAPELVASGNRVGSRLWLAMFDERCSRTSPHTTAVFGSSAVTVEAVAANDWNRTAAARWREPHRRARQATRREFGPSVLSPLARVWELQKRGALHVHVVLGFNSPLAVAAARFHASRVCESERASSASGSSTLAIEMERRDGQQ